MTTAIERSVHGGRGLTAGPGGTAEESDIGWPAMAYESVPAINHLIGHGHPIPAPVLYDVLGNLKGLGFLLPQALTKLGDGLSRSLETFRVYDRDGEPRANVEAACGCLQVAARAARELGDALEAAQSVIAGQGYVADER